MASVLVTGPVGEPLSVDEVRAHCRVDDEREDPYLRSLISVARRFAEARTGRAFLTQTWRTTRDYFPWSDDGLIRLPHPPLQSVTSVAYVDGAGATQTFAASSYVVETDAFPGQLRLAYGLSWPTTRGQPQAVTITYVAGYGLAAAVPDDLKHAMKLLVGHLYENREPVITGTIASTLPMGVDALLGPHRLVEVP